jgi:Acyl-CoA synthetases (AMP-forming)/AMP-acid ligases II
MLYVDQTSGTTGPSKGVILDEAVFLAMAEVECADLEISSRSVVLIDRWGSPGWQKVCWARVSGCRLSIYPGREKASLREWIRHKEVTHVSVQATTFRYIVSGLYRFDNVKVIDVGGDMVDWGDARQSREYFPNAVFFNRYSITETRPVCRKRVERDQPTGEGRMPVGLPVKGVSVAIDDNTQEILVSSPYMAEGYYNDPELTATKFVNGWYHTGDKGHWLPNGELMHEGRMP